MTTTTGRGILRSLTNSALVVTALVLVWTAAKQGTANTQRRELPSPGLSPGTEFPSLALMAANGDTVDIVFSTETGSSCSFRAHARSANNPFRSISR